MSDDCQYTYINQLKMDSFQLEYCCNHAVSALVAIGFRSDSSQNMPDFDSSKHRG